ncbi:MAG: hypothetical protein M1816_003024 [Peltula sp. TS41687]|nr:MAG: hypothetical protein M1816_003024 [Peltula sp. TS41687]
MKLAQHWSAIVILTTLAVGSHLAVGVPLDEDRFILSSDLLGTTTGVGERGLVAGQPRLTARDAGVEGALRNRLPQARKRRRSVSQVADELHHGQGLVPPDAIEKGPIGGTREEVVQATLRNPHFKDARAMHLGVAEDRVERQREKENEASQGRRAESGVESAQGSRAVNHPSSRFERRADKAKVKTKTKAKTKAKAKVDRVEAITPEELKTVLSPEQILEFERLREASRTWYSLRRKDKKGVLTKEQKEIYEAALPLHNLFRRWQRAIQKQLIKSGKVRQEVIERKQEDARKQKEYHKVHRGTSTARRIEKAMKDNARRKELGNKVHQGLSPEEQQEFDVLEAKRLRKNARQRALYWEKKAKEEAAQMGKEEQGVKGPLGAQVSQEVGKRESSTARENSSSESASDLNESRNSPLLKISPERLEMSAGQPSRMGTSTTDMQNPAVHRQSNSWYGLPSDFVDKLSGMGNNLVDNLSKVARRLGSLNIKPLAPALTPGAAVWVPR